MDRLYQAKKYFESQLSPKEAEEFLNWFLSSEADEVLKHEIGRLWQAENPTAYEPNVTSLLEKIKEDSRSEGVFLNSSEKAKSYTFLKVAASLLILASATFLVFKFNKEAIDTPQPQGLEYITKSNPIGQKSKIHLPDGTLVNLNAESTISYASQFLNERQVELTGEAFFDVKKDPKRPFSVVTGRLTTTALGTSFNINTLNGSGQIKVALVTGKIEVRDEVTQRSLYLNPGEGTEVMGDSEVFDKYDINTTVVTNWYKGIILFDETPLSEVIKTLERWYGVHITVTGTPEQVRCSGTFNNEYLDNVLDVLSHTVGFSFKIDNKDVNINFKERI